MPQSLLTKKARGGFTLIEIICVVALVSVVGSIVFRIFSIGLNVERRATNEYNHQTKMRQAADVITDYIRYSTAAFVMPESYFNEHDTTTLDTKWEYIGPQQNEEGKWEIVHIKYTEDDDGNVITEVKPLLVEDEYYYYTLNIGTVTGNDRMVQFQLQSHSQTRKNLHMDLSAQVEAVNTMQVTNNSTSTDLLDSSGSDGGEVGGGDDGGDDGGGDDGGGGEVGGSPSAITGGAGIDPGAGLAFRTDEREVDRTRNKGRITFLLDLSGSMVEFGRLESLQKAMNSVVQIFLEDIKGEGEVEVCIITYDSSADTNRNSHVETLYTSGVYSYLDLKSNATDIIKSFDYYIAEGGTNLGDAFRRAGHLMKNNPLPANTKEYLIVMTDGQSNMATLTLDQEQISPDPNDPLVFDLEDGNISDRGSGNDNDRYYVDQISGTRYFLEGYPEYLTAWSRAIYWRYNDYDEEIHEYLKLTGPPLVKKVNASGGKCYLVIMGDQVTGKPLTDLCKIMGANPDEVIFEEGAAFEARFERIASDIVAKLWHISGPQ